MKKKNKVICKEMVSVRLDRDDIDNLRKMQISLTDLVRNYIKQFLHGDIDCPVCGKKFHE
jgi:uncharacterized protein (DUF4415 family)